MPKQIADGVLVYESEFLQTNAIVVQGRAGVLLIDPGIQRSEIAAIADDVNESGQPVVTAFSTHPHWDHVLWHAELGDPPRYGTERCAAAIRDVVSDAGWRNPVAKVLPPDFADQVPLELFGLITGLPADALRIPWDGPHVRIIEHQAHAPGHAALLIEERRVLVAGDMLSDVLIPFLYVEGGRPDRGLPRRTAAARGRSVRVVVVRIPPAPDRWAHGSARFALGSARSCVRPCPAWCGWFGRPTAPAIGRARRVAARCAWMATTGGRPTRKARREGQAQRDGGRGEPGRRSALVDLDGSGLRASP